MDQNDGHIKDVLVNTKDVLVNGKDVLVNDGLAQARRGGGFALATAVVSSCPLA